MSEIDVNQLRADIEVGKEEPWMADHRVCDDGSFRTQVYPVADPDNTICTVEWHSIPIGNGFRTDREQLARRIARLPDLEQAYLDLRKENERLREALGQIETSTDTKEQGRIATAALIDIPSPEGSGT